MADFVTESVYTMIDGRIVKRIGVVKISLDPNNPSKGRIVRDGRDVQLVKDPIREECWVYIPE